MFKQLLINVLAVPVYWIGAIYYTQNFAYAIATLAAIQGLLAIINYTRIKSAQEREIAQFLAKMGKSA